MRSLVTFIIFIVCFCPLYGQSKELPNLQEIIDKASVGDDYSQSKLVDYYYNTAKNYTETIKWCKIIAANPNAEDNKKEYANRILGYCAHNGTGMEKSIENAITYWKRGVEHKGGSCALSLARVYDSHLKDLAEAIRWYKQSAELENKTAAYFLAQLYENGFAVMANGTKKYYPNVGKDISQAFKYYDIYIKYMGYSWSKVPANSKLLYKLAQWNYSGEGSLPKNYSRAFNLFNDAVESNNNSKEEYKLSTQEEGKALWCISVCYRFGQGVEKDELIARRFVKMAARKGNENAISLLNE